MKLSVAVVLGTRPEIIKMAPIIRELQRKKINFFIVHTGQHYSYNLDRVFFEQLRLPKPQYKLEVICESFSLLIFCREVICESLSLLVFCREVICESLSLLVFCREVICESLSLLVFCREVICESFA